MFWVPSVMAEMLSIIASNLPILIAADVWSSQSARDMQCGSLRSRSSPMLMKSDLASAWAAGIAAAQAFGLAAYTAI
jgi:hypothetical protein